MKKSNIILVVAFTLLAIGFFLMWLSEDYLLIVFEQDNNIILNLSNNFNRFICGSSLLLTLTTFSVLWKKRWFPCHENMFIEKSDFYISLFMAVFFFFTPFVFITSSSFIYINGIFDHSPSYQIQNVVIDKNKHRGNKNGIIYTLVLKNDQKFIYLPVKADEYERTNYNDNVIITAKNGFLNTPWRKNYQIIPHSQ